MSKLVPTRSWMLHSVTVGHRSVSGMVFVTVTYDATFKPQEVFINIGKSGAEISAVGEALGRILTAFIRHECSAGSVDRLVVAIDQLSGIGSRKQGELTSLPDTIAKALGEAMNGIELLSTADAK